MRLEAGRRRHRGERRLTLAIALLVGISGLIGGVAYLLPAIVRPRCPVCMRRGARLVSRRRGYDHDDRRSTYFEERYACGPCGAELVRRDGGPLVTKQAWEAGMREAPPAATVVARR